MDFAAFLAQYLEGKIQKISVNAGMTCPNRDGRKGVGGCTYCNNQTFSPEYTVHIRPITEQLQEGIAFFSKKYPAMRYLAYFQSYTNTYDSPERLMALYREALSLPQVVGLVIGTRPDCVSQELLDQLQELSKETFLLIEYGIESTNEQTLKRINRGHTYADAVQTIVKTANRGILVGAHLILGLPGEDRFTQLEHADKLSKLPLSTLKLHQLQLIKGTVMAKEYAVSPQDFHLYTMDEYIDLAIDFLERLSPDIVVERLISQSPKSLLIAPDWGVKNHVFTDRFKSRQKERSSFQGKQYCSQK